MATMNIHDAKTHFSKLINRVLEGEEMIIAKGGKQLVKMVPFEEQDSPRRGGQFKGLIEIADDFDAPLPDDIAKPFQGVADK
jgi:prevent-host-death family protein